MASLDREIRNASDTIDKALSHITKENRGEIARNVLSVVRTLNDNIAEKLWQEIEPMQKMDINKVASKFINKRPYQFIAQFDSYLRKSLSHFIPTEDGAERLMIKYYRYILSLKKLMKQKYNIDIVDKIDLFLLDLDEQTKDYYTKVAIVIEQTTPHSSYRAFDNYYISRIKPFFINRNTYYEVTLEPAEEKPNKFNRITAFTKYEITTNYSVALRFARKNIHIFDIDFPIEIITEWKVSIRPCEFNNFARILQMKISVVRGLNEYKTLMDYLTQDQLSLVEIIDMDQATYSSIKDIVANSTKEKNSRIFDMLDTCRSLSMNKLQGMNILRYILNRMNNRIIKEQWPDSPEKCWNNFYLSTKCFAFDNMPFSINPKGHYSDIHDLLECIEIKGKEHELLARHIEKNTTQNGVLYTQIEDLTQNKTEKEILDAIAKYNLMLYSGFKPDGNLKTYGKYVYNYGYEYDLLFILKQLKLISQESSLYFDCFTDEKINNLKQLKGSGEILDDPMKESILRNLFNDSRVHFIYGAAGTGKSTLINHVAKLITGKRRIFLAKTNPAVENLRHKITEHEDYDEFITIDRFTRSSRYALTNYDLIVVDECSTVKNGEIAKILNMLHSGVLILAGDIYQIQAIGFGNWFQFARNFMPKSCCSELNTPYRSTDEDLKAFWNEVRIMKEDNIILEKMVRDDYSHIIDKTIFEKKANDEIILCLNYNGLYGLNNINKLLQLSNPKPSISIGIWQFKVGDPVLFNDSERFDVLYNNLKGKIVDLKDNGANVYCEIVVDLQLSERDINLCPGLSYIKGTATKTTVGFNVIKRAPYSSDNDTIDNEYILPFQIAYAVSIHKSQGLEYDSVKIVIADDSEDRITHSIFYTAVTRAKKHLTIYWSPEVCNRVLKQLALPDNKDYLIFSSKNEV